MSKNLDPTILETSFKKQSTSYVSFMVSFKHIKLKLLCIPPRPVMVHDAWLTITKLNCNKVFFNFAYQNMWTHSLWFVNQDLQCIVRGRPGHDSFLNNFWIYSAWRNKSTRRGFCRLNISLFVVMGSVPKWSCVAFWKLYW